MKIFRQALKVIILFIFIVVAFLASGFFAVRWGWTNVAGETDENSDYYNSIAKEKVVFAEPVENSNISSSSLPTHLSLYGTNEKHNWCLLAAAVEASPYDAVGIFKAYRETKSETLLKRMLLSLELRKGSASNFSASMKRCDNEPGIWNEESLVQVLSSASGTSAYTWQSSEYWQIIKQSIIKDKDRIYKASEISGVQPRLLVSVAIVEQLRLYYTQRELFEKLFKPLKILANANKMAWGVMSIKEKMAIETENHLRDSASSFYLGPDMANALDFPTGTDIAKERYNRLTNEKDHYYSYLYGSLIIREFQEQWLKSGYDLKYRPEIIATLFNIGFNNSKPKENPAVGGSTLEINGEKYFFGSLAYEFYYSGELAEEFPFD